MANLSIDPPIGTWRLTKQALSSFRRRGIVGTLKRIAGEISVPTTALGKGLNVAAVGASDFLAAPGRMLVRPLGGRATSRDVLHAFYDLKVEPYSYDFLWFLAGADIERRRKGLRHIHVVIVPDGAGRVRARAQDIPSEISEPERNWRVGNILVDSVALLPACNGLTLCANRAQARLLQRVSASVYPRRYRVAFPVAHNPRDIVDAGRSGMPVAVLRSPPQARSYVAQWMKSRTDGRRPVSITLRESAFSSSRNSNVQAWVEFADRIRQQGYAPIFVRDTDAAMEAAHSIFDGQDIFHEAPWNPSLRMALYESCYLNFGVNNGPCAMGWLNDRVRYLTLKLQVPGLPHTSDAAFRIRGMEPGESLPFARTGQKWVWQADELDIISQEFDLACREIEGLAVDSGVEGTGEKRA